tara:strand:- start:1120 stop:1416 length:297 start_codon:yes stop_codon:yes gene_type:complete
MSKKIFIKTFGCQMNEYDSNRIFDIVKKIGFEKTKKYEDANCYLLNTCHIRDKAKEKVYHEIGRVKKIFRKKKKTYCDYSRMCGTSRKSGDVKKRTLY